jgi:hypothetical protein
MQPVGGRPGYQNRRSAREGSSRTPRSMRRLYTGCSISERGLAARTSSHSCAKSLADGRWYLAVHGQVDGNWWANGQTDRQTDRQTTLTDRQGHADARRDGGSCVLQAPPKAQETMR